MTTDDFTTARFRGLVDETNALYRAHPPRPHECLVAVAGEPLRRCAQDELVAELRADDLRATARRVSKAVIPVDHVLLLLVGVETEVLMLRLDDLDLEPSVEPEARRAGACALGPLGLLASGGAR